MATVGTLTLDSWNLGSCCWVAKLRYFSTEFITSGTVIFFQACSIFLFGTGNGRQAWNSRRLKPNMAGSGKPQSTWEAHMTRPFFQPKSSPISRPMKPRRSQSHIPNCASCCSKSSAADMQWKYLICVCEGVVLRECDLIIRMSVVWRWEPFDAR